MVPKVPVTKLRLQLLISSVLQRQCLMRRRLPLLLRIPRAMAVEHGQLIGRWSCNAPWENAETRQVLKARELTRRLLVLGLQLCKNP